MKHKFSLLRWMAIFIIVLAALPINVFASEDSEAITVSDAVMAVQAQYPDDEIIGIYSIPEIGCWVVELSSATDLCVSLHDGTVSELTFEDEFEDTDEGEDFSITSEQAIEAVLSVNPEAEILSVELYVDEAGLGLWFVDLASGEYFVVSAEDGTILDIVDYSDDEYEDDYSDDEDYDEDFDFDLCYDELTGEALDHECFDEECYDDFSAEEWCYDEWYEDDYSDDEWYEDDYSDDEWYEDDYSDDEWYDDDYSNDEWYDDDYSDDEWYDDDYSDDEWYDDDYSDEGYDD